MGLNRFRASFSSDADDWTEVRRQLERPSLTMLWCWDAHEPGPNHPFLGKWPIETRPFVLCDEQETTRLGLPVVDLFVYSDPSPRLHEDLRRCYGAGRDGELRGMRELFSQGHDTVVTLKEMIPLTLDAGRELEGDAEALGTSLMWTNPGAHERHLFTYLGIDTTYDDGSTENESHAVIYTPLPPHRVVEVLLPAIGVAPTYLLDTGRGRWRGKRGPVGYETMGEWVEAKPPRFLFAPDAYATGWNRVTPGFKWSQRPDEPSDLRPHLFRRA